MFPVIAISVRRRHRRISSSSSSSSSCSCCCCCWQHVRLPPRGVRRFPGWHVLKLEFWHFPLPKFILRFLFLSVFAVFLAKKNAHTAACTGPKTCSAVRFASFFSVFSCLCRLSHRYLQCFGHLSTFCTCQLRLALVFELCAGVWGGGGDGGGGGDDVHATATGVLIFFS